MNKTLDISNISELTLISSTVDTWDTGSLILNVLTVLTCVCGMVGNGVVVWLLGFCVQRNPFSVYVLNLAVADFLFLLCLAISLNVEFFKKVTELKFFYDRVRIMLFFAYSLGLSLLTVISIQRCLSILFPIWYKVHRPQHLSTVVCTLLWMFSFLVIALAIFFCETEGHQCFNMDISMNAVILGIFTPVMILSSVVIFVQVQRRPQQWHRHHSRLFVIILVSVLVFVVCSLPLGVFWTLIYRLQIPSSVCYLFMNLTYFTSSLSSSANPFIYFLVGKGRVSRHQQTLRALLSQALREDPELKGQETSSTNINEVGSVIESPMVSAQGRAVLG